ncbi:response regulator [Microbacterium stercoris]|uniref:Response regulator transcription factor n=1 Tax=Microbacterium stercoris TaxID=2820289 RepID=A0A939QHV5_9MICO|nr:response regulator transcription factor [Microbacterium stercoris]MBO3662964.1 response regulator transcription factor [Microbacterium stercoris]
MTIRVLIADDDPLVRRALSFFVEDATDLALIGEAADGAEAVARCRDLRPDVVLMDIRMPGTDGLAAIEVLARELPDVRVIAVTTYASDETVLAALLAGAVGFLVKDTDPDQIVAAVRAAHEGGFVLSPAVARELVQSVAATVRAPQPLSPIEAVSERERDVISLVARGLSNAEIARELFLAEATVKSHLRRIMLRWKARDRTQVLIRAVRAGLVRLD